MTTGTSGPVEYVVIEFPDNQIHGEIAPALADLTRRGVVHILDLVFVKKDGDGAIESFEFDDVEAGASFAMVDGEADGLIGEDDIRSLAEALAPDSAALMVLFEDLWAKDLGEAVWKAGGELVAGGRIPRDVITASLAELELQAPGASS